MKLDKHEATDRTGVILSMVAIGLFMLHQFVSIIDYTYSILTGLENEALSVSGLFYLLGRLFVYGIFIHRLKFVFQGTFNPYPDRVISAAYWNLVIIIISMLAFFIGFAGGIEPLLFIGGFSLVIFDIILCAMLPLLFVGKLYQLIEFADSVRRTSVNKNVGLNYNENNNTSDNVSSSINLGNGSADSKIESPTASSQPIEVIHEKSPVNESKNKFKEQTLVFTAGKISLLSCITLLSMIFIIPIAVGLQGFGNNSWLGSLPEALVKIDEVINVICVCLCFKVNDEWYFDLCKCGHTSCQGRPCFACWKCCYLGCMLRCLE